MVNTRCSACVEEGCATNSGGACYYSCGCHAIPAQEVRIKDPLTGGEKGQKPERFSLIPAKALAEVARVYGYGAKKYADHNWRKGYKWSLSLDALGRHINAFQQGIDLDSESGIHHLAHAIFHCMALIEWKEIHPEMDDRIKNG